MGTRTVQPNTITLIAGATAAGKSAFAEELARTHNGVIINADALQIYDALPILTAQPDLETRARLPHDLYGTLQPGQVCNAQDWVHMAIAAVRAAWQNDQHAIIVGGTGLYLKSLVYGLSPIPNVPDDIRAKTRDLHARLGNPAFHAELSRLDPMMTARLNPNDSQRLMRAHEVIVATGKSLAEWQAEPPVPPLPGTSIKTMLVDGARDVLRARARKRLYQMVEMGVVDEVAKFYARIESGELAGDCAPVRALGFSAFVDAVHGKIGIETAIARAHIETCQYIKRQQTWFRHQMVFAETARIV